MKKIVLSVIALWLFTQNNFSICPASSAGEMNTTVKSLTFDQKKRLINIARKTVELFVHTGKVYQVNDKDPRMSEEEGTFVTLRNQGQLRGCIGNILGRGPLYLLVRDMAIGAAAEDPRFSPVREDELSNIEVEVSVLSKPWVTKNIDDITMGVHGVIVSRGMFNQGVFLPQVATETGWDKDQFLSELCSQKAGLPSDCYKDPTTTIRIFTADVFSEKDLK